MKLARMLPEEERKELIGGSALAIACVRMGECTKCGFECEEAGVQYVCDCSCHGHK